MACRPRPLTDIRTIVDLIGATTTTSGLTVQAAYDPNWYPTGEHIATNGGPWRGLDDFEVAICGWVAWFNTERLHSELDDATPAEIEAACHRDHPGERAA